MNFQADILHSNDSIIKLERSFCFNGSTSTESSFYLNFNKKSFELKHSP
jgi:hypothetical protein